MPMAPFLLTKTLRRHRKCDTSRKVVQDLARKIEIAARVSELSAACITDSRLVRRRNQKSRPLVDVLQLEKLSAKTV